MKRFSDEMATDREFEIGGEMFRWQYPHWSEIVAIFDGDADENGDLTTARANMEAFIQRIPIFLDPADDARARWDQVVTRKENPVPYYQFSALYRWLLEATSGRPTEPPSPSANGPTTAEPTSTDASE